MFGVRVIPEPEVNVMVLFTVLVGISVVSTVTVLYACLSGVSKFISLPLTLVDMVMPVPGRSVLNCKLVPLVAL